MNVDNIFEELLIWLGVATILCLFKAVRKVAIAIVKAPWQLNGWRKNRAIKYEQYDYEPVFNEYTQSRKAGWFKRHGLYIKK